MEKGPERNDADLLEAARGGDQEALEQLLVRHEARVYRFGLKMCRDPEDARDVAQETLLAMARSVREFRGGSSVSTWLYSIARSFCVKRRRRGKSVPLALESLESGNLREVEAIPDEDRGPEQSFADRELEAAVESAIDSLDSAQREVVVLRDVEGLSSPEVADVLGISVQAVKSRLHRARSALREKVAPVLGVSAGLPAARPAGCPDVLELFSQHVEGDIGADVCAEMEKHLEVCAHCKGACDSLKRTLALCKAAPVVRMPEEVQESVRAAIRDFLDRVS